MIKDFEDLKKRVEKLTGYKFKPYFPGDPMWGDSTYKAEAEDHLSGVLLKKEQDPWMDDRFEVELQAEAHIPLIGSSGLSKEIYGSFSDMDLLFRELQKLWREKEKTEAVYREARYISDAEMKARFRRAIAESMAEDRKPQKPRKPAPRKKTKAEEMSEFF